jgi:hypothetical protein
MSYFGFDSKTMFDKDGKSVYTRLAEHDVSISANTSKVSGVNNVKQYNVVGDGVVGDSSTIQSMINTVRSNVIGNGLSSFYTVEIPSGTYIIDQEIKMSPYIKLKSNGVVIFKLTFNGTAFWISPSSDDPIYGNNDNTKPLHLRKNTWNRGEYFDGSNGGFIFMTALDLATTGNNTTAIEFGDRVSTSNAALPVSRYTINNVNVFGLNNAFKWNGVNHYIGTYKHCHIESNNHAVNIVSLSSGNPVNSGENFIFENCVFAGSKLETFLIGCAGHDISFNDCSFDFNSSPVIRSLYSGISIRVNNCYLEKINYGIGDQLFYQSENTISGTDYRRSSFYTKNFIMFLDRPSQIIKNVANASSSFINLFVDLELEMRYSETEVSAPYTLSDRYLLDVGQNITIMKHRVINTSLRKNLVSKDLNLLSDGDFLKSALGANLYTTPTDPYWVVDYKLNVSDPMIVAEGVSNSNCLKWTINTAGNNSVRLTSLWRYQVEAGEFLNLSTLFKTDKIDNNCQFIYRFECYDPNNSLLTTINFYDFPTGDTGLKLIDSSQFRMSRSNGVAQVPPGTVTVKPILIISNQQGSTFWLDDIHFSKSK